jgi:HTH-type transcriptional regulator / antitoxin HigA
MKKRKNEYFPDTVTHPGFTLDEKLREMDMGPKEFAIRTGKPEKTISQVLAGESSITTEMAILFEDVTQIPAHFWMNRQQQYNEALARIKRKEALQEAIEWSKDFPYADMAKLGWVPRTRDAEEKVASLFRFFGLTSPRAFEDYYFAQKLKVSFRISLAHTKMPFAFAAWLRQGEITARQLESPSYNARRFEESLPAIKAIMAAHPTNFFRKTASHLSQSRGKSDIHTLPTGCHRARLHPLDWRHPPNTDVGTL